MPLSIHVHRRLPDSQVYACSKRDAKAGLTALDVADVHFGLSARYDFESNCSKRPDLTGNVVASVAIDRERVTSVHLYPVAASEFSAREMQLFVETQLPAIAAWTRCVLELPATQVVGHQQLIIESVVDGFRRHEVSFP
ncbi:MAG: hypothetical protein A2289_16960 [Deltaproteobacteria bacterium RIFOXYA12_FULL_58_15]|nr:MAG: hypothetical protein A2289_16960 [Deltaproteobacteria bacterium RIFOXYA12_FULL_58_15]OGR09959.1 MAG: hypothetical protein A2341_12365 [Deltaproteobacteria bacterium RIFOXYB12_FULL_58_9]